MADDDILFISPNDGSGVVFLWKDGRWTAKHEDVTVAIEKYLIATSNSLHEYFRGPAGDRTQTIDERMVGTPALEFGPALVAAIEEHYQLSKVQAELPQNFSPRSIVIVPAHRDPLQALLADRIGHLSPRETTFARPAQNRVIRTISVWPGATMLTGAEVTALGAIARTANWQFKVTTGDLNEAAFEQFYCDPTADVLWVIGHGEHSPYRTSETGLVIADGVLLPMARISSYEVPRCGRRLLVLNVCSAGSAHTSEGVASVGFGHSVVSPWQSVVAHHWPIGLQAALAFGCAFASRLRSASPAKALHDSMNLMKNSHALLAEITSISPELEALSRLQDVRVTDDINNVLSWGCPILLT